MRGRVCAWLGASFFGVTVVYYCALTLIGLMRYLNNFTL